MLNEAQDLVEAMETVRDWQRQLHWHYVYVLCSAKTGLPFYVGKGTRHRVVRHRHRWPEFLVVFDSFYLTSDEAFERERELIAFLRCHYTLLNIGSGGEGGYNEPALLSSNSPKNREAKRLKALEQWATRRADMIKGIRATCATAEFSAKMRTIMTPERARNASNARWRKYYRRRKYGTTKLA